MPLLHQTTVPTPQPRITHAAHHDAPSQLSQYDTDLPSTLTITKRSNGVGMGQQHNSDNREHITVPTGRHSKGTTDATNTPWG
eukprot:10157019-Prorocentrum_lima.AAC.1